MEVFVPGRVCLFGEHSDWAGAYRRFDATVDPGACIVCGTNQGLHARVRAHPRLLKVTARSHTGERLRCLEVPMDRDALLAEARSGSYFSYVAGVAYQVLERFDVKGLVIDNYKTTLPAQKGLSSSAAVCVLVARAFSAVYGLRLTPRGEMDLAYQGEITTPSQCGRMDQCCAFGLQPVLMEFDGDWLTTTPLTLGGPLHLVIVELGAHKDTVVILRDLNQCYSGVLRDTPIAKGVRELLGPRNHEITTQAIEALAAGDSQRLGELMTHAQALFDQFATPACPAELTAPVLHRVLAHAALRPHIYGGKGVGSQGDGCAQFVAKSAEDQAEVVRIVKEDLGMDCLSLTIGPGAQPGVDGWTLTDLPRRLLACLGTRIPTRPTHFAAASCALMCATALALGPMALSARGQRMASR